MLASLESPAQKELPEDVKDDNNNDEGSHKLF